MGLLINNNINLGIVKKYRHSILTPRASKMPYVIWIIGVKKIHHNDIKYPSSIFHLLLCMLCIIYCLMLIGFLLLPILSFSNVTSKWALQLIIHTIQTLVVNNNDKKCPQPFRIAGINCKNVLAILHSSISACWNTLICTPMWPVLGCSQEYLEGKECIIHLCYIENSCTQREKLKPLSFG